MSREQRAEYRIYINANGARVYVRIAATEAEAMAGFERVPGVEYITERIAWVRSHKWGPWAEHSRTSWPTRW